MTYPVLVNGQPDYLIDIRDRGFQYGDGLFETVAVRDGRPLRWGLHAARLTEGCRRLGIPQPDTALFLHELKALCDGVERAVAKLQLTRGIGGRGYRAPERCKPTRVVGLHPWPNYPAGNATEGVRVRLCDTRLGWNSALAGLKHMNRLEQVLARSEWSDPAIWEGLMLDQAGCVVEGTMTNLFMVRHGDIVTPSLDRCGVRGVMRACVIDHAGRLGLPVNERAIGIDELGTADELFLTNSLIGVWPVREVDGRAYEPGPVARKLQAVVAATDEDEPCAT